MVGTYAATPRRPAPQPMMNAEPIEDSIDEVERWTCMRLLVILSTV